MLEHIEFLANHVVFSLSHEEVPSRMVSLAVPLHVAVKKRKYHRRRDGIAHCFRGNCDEVVCSVVRALTDQTGSPCFDSDGDCRVFTFSPSLLNSKCVLLRQHVLKAHHD